MKTADGRFFKIHTNGQIVEWIKHVPSEKVMFFPDSAISDEQLGDLMEVAHIALKNIKDFKQSKDTIMPNEYNLFVSKDGRYWFWCYQHDSDLGIDCFKLIGNGNTLPHDFYKTFNSKSKLFNYIRKNLGYGHYPLEKEDE